LSEVAELHPHCVLLVQVHSADEVRSTIEKANVRASALVDDDGDALAVTVIFGNRFRRCSAAPQASRDGRSRLLPNRGPDLLSRPTRRPVVGSPRTR
jgi:hypothetical protein